MEGKKAEARKAGGSSSSSSSSSALPSELLDRKAASATAGLFDSVFSTPISSSQVVSRTSACSITIGSSSVEGHAKQPANAQTAAATARGPFCLEDPNKELSILSMDQSLFSMNEKAATFSLCSSIYYGGQDICVQARPPESTKNYKNDGEEDIGDFAHRGDWWQGSLYY